MMCLLFLWKRAGHTLLPCNLSPKLQGATANKKLPYFMVPKTLSVWRIIIHPLGRKDCLTSRARRRSCRSSQSCFPWLSQLLSSSPNTFGCWWRICHNPLCTSSPSGLNPHRGCSLPSSHVATNFWFVFRCHGLFLSRKSPALPQEPKSTAWDNIQGFAFHSSQRWGLLAR